MELISPAEFAKSKIESVQEYTFLSARALANLFKRPIYTADMIQQADFIGFGSLSIVLSSCFFIGVALALNSATTLGRFGAQTLIGELVAIGVVRELENVIERAVVLSSGDEIALDLLPDSMMGRGSSVAMNDSHPDASLFEIVEDCERRIISDMLEKCNWNQTEAAERFHVPLSTLNQKIRRLNIEIRKKGRG